MTAPRFTCEACGETFDKDRADGEADAEAFELFGVVNASADPEMAVVCDDCFKQLRDGGALDAAPPAPHDITVCLLCWLMLGVSTVEVNWSGGTWACTTCPATGVLPVADVTGIEVAS